MYVVYCAGRDLPHHPLCIVAEVAITQDQMDYRILENEQVVTVTLALNDIYRADIV